VTTLIQRYVVALLVHYDCWVETALLRMLTQVVYGLALEPVTGKSPRAGQREEQTTYLRHIAVGVLNGCVQDLDKHKQHSSSK
jgi:hypothetical protein